MASSGKKETYQVIDSGEGEATISSRLTDAMVELRRLQSNSDDMITILKPTAGGVQVGMLMFDGMVSNQQVSDFLLRPVAGMPASLTEPEQVYRYLQEGVLMASEIKEARTYAQLLTMAMSGFAAVLVDGCSKAILLGYQGFSTRGVGEPSSENNLRGSREGFSESVIMNLSLIRRRLKSPRLVVEGTTVGTLSNTAVKLIYLRGVASDALVRQIKEELDKIKINVVLDSGYLQTFLSGGKPSIFSGVWVTERPDTLCAKISEGRVAVMVDGTPFVLIVPYLFVEHFQSLDDYSHRPYFASFVRILKFTSFLITILLPGYYVAAVSFHPELIPETLLTQFVGSAAYTPLPVLFEAMVVFLLYELLREAGLRLPRPIGHTLGIVGGIVIGDAAVKAGIIGLPMVIIIAITAISSFVVPSLYEPVTLLRFGFILIGGLLGLFGVYLGFTLFVVNLCAVKTMGMPFTSPASPLDRHSFRDIFIRSSWRKLQEDTLIVQNIPGSDRDGKNLD